MVNLNYMFLNNEIASQTVAAYPHYAHRYAIVIDFTKSFSEFLTYTRVLDSNTFNRRYTELEL